MNDETQLTIRSVERRDTTLLNMAVEARHGTFGGCVTFWCATEVLRNVGEALIAFPAKVPDKYEYYFEGNENLSLTARTMGSTGRSELTIYLVSHLGTCELHIPVEPWSINRLGHLLTKLADPSNLEIHWTPLDPAVHS